MARSDYERAYDYMGAEETRAGVRAPEEPRHIGGVIAADIAAGASHTFVTGLNMDMELDTIILPDAIAPDVDVMSMTIGAVQLNAGDGPIPGDSFRRDSLVRLRPAVPITSSQPLRVTIRNNTTATLLGVKFSVIGKVARPR